MPTITSTKTIRAVCKRAGLRLSKDLGQNFLCNASVAERLVSTAGVGPNDIVIEPGAGIGAVTFHLAKRAKKVIAIEIDQNSAKALKELSEGFEYKNIEIVTGDVLSFQPEKYGLDSSEFKVVGSLPYDLAKKIIRKFIEQEVVRPSIISVLIQREVAKEYVANPPAGTFLARYAEIYANVKYIQTVTKQAFFPIPPVDGAILQFCLKKKPLVPKSQVETYRKFLKLCFSAKRKTLLNTLTGYKNVLGAHLSRDDLVSIFDAIAISSSSRPQELTSDVFVSLFVRAHGARTDKRKQN